MQRNKAILTMLAAATVMTAVPALAQDTGDRATHFNGFYIGAGGGYDMTGSDSGSTVAFDTDRNGSFDNNVTVAGANAFQPLNGNPAFCDGYPNGGSPTADTGCRGDKDRGTYFGRVGYDRRMGNFVVGLVLEGGKSDSVDRTTAYSTSAQSYNFSRGIDWYGAARLRAGYTPNGGILFYGTGGGIYANMSHGFATTNRVASFSQNNKDDAWGYQAGGGIEAMVTQKISIGLEYLYTDIDDDKYFVTAVGGAFGTGTNMRPSDQGYNFHSVRGTVNFRF
ncbi:MAG TPA: outer membrane beta-barrel protein [Sphingobium sp.]